jgi:hypothetical protein
MGVTRLRSRLPDRRGYPTPSGPGLDASTVARELVPLLTEAALLVEVLSGALDDAKAILLELGVPEEL